MFSGLLIKARVNEEDNFNEYIFAVVLVVLNAVPICVGVARVVFLMRMALQKILAKRHIIEELSHKGAVKDVLKTPKFPKVDAKTLKEVDKHKSTSKDASEKYAAGSEKVGSKKSKKRWFGKKKSGGSATGQTGKPAVTRMSELESQLENIHAPAAPAAAPEPLEPSGIVTKVQASAEV